MWRSTTDRTCRWKRWASARLRHGSCVCAYPLWDCLRGASQCVRAFFIPRNEWYIGRGKNLFCTAFFSSLVSFKASFSFVPYRKGIRDALLGQVLGYVDLQCRTCHFQVNACHSFIRAGMKAACRCVIIIIKAKICTNRHSVMLKACLVLQLSDERAFPCFCLV